MDFSPDVFQARARALEAAFFRKRDAELLARMRSQLAEMEEREKVAHVSGILDEQLLLDLVRMGVTAETLLAMRFVPMVAVAWSDDVVSAEEQAAILKSVEAEDIAPGSPAYQLLRDWLERRPDEAVIAAWKAYISELARIMPAESLEKLRQRTESLCYQVAKASGGFLGIGSISHAEQTAIDEFVNSWKSV
jgi:hypothetical protein